MNDEARMSNDEGMNDNDETRMTNDERMTKSKTPREEFDEAFWNDATALKIREEPGANRVYELEERTARFGEAVIDFTRMIPQEAVTNRIISQLVGAATSVGANYVEADDAVSKKEFLKSIGTCKKEARENQPFSSHDRPSRAGIETKGSCALA